MVSAEPTDLRKIRGIEIANTNRIVKTENGWLVPSQTRRGKYLVIVKDNDYACNCPDFEIRQERCKHIFAVEAVRNGIGEVSIIAIRKTYPQNWNAYNISQGVEKQLFMKMLADMCDSVEEPAYSFGRPKISFKDMIFCCAFKVYSLYSLRRFTTDMRTAKEKGYIEIIPCFASVGHFFQREELTQILMDLITKSSLPLKSVETSFAIDASGFSTSRFGRYYDFRYGKSERYKTWIKAHLVCGVKTNIITAVKITDDYTHESQFFNNLITKTSENFEIKEVLADRGYSSRKSFEIVDELGGTAYIPFRRHTSGKARGSRLWSKMFHYFMYNNEEFMNHYHKRSKVETTFHMIKSKFGDSLRSKTKTAQINEVLCKILCHNICVLIHEMHELRIEIDS
jgi:transposase